MKQSKTPFWEHGINPITGFKVPKYIQTQPVDPEIRKTRSEKYRAKVKARILKAKKHE